MIGHPSAPGTDQPSLDGKSGPGAPPQESAAIDETDIVRPRPLVRWCERALDPVLGKSLVLYVAAPPLGPGFQAAPPPSRGRLGGGDQASFRAFVVPAGREGQT